MLRHVSIAPTVLDRIVHFLAPLFQDAAAGNCVAARQAATATLAGYGARTDTELRLAALIIAFGFGALDALSRAVDPTLTVNQVLRLRGNANALNRAAQQNETRLEDLRRQRVEDVTERQASDPLPQSEPMPQTEPLPELPTSTAPAELLAFARANPAPALSRQQRRFAERQAEKQRLRQQQEARLAQRAADRAATRGERLRA